MERDELPGSDPNTLPYFVLEAQTGQRVPVHFAPITAADEAELRGIDWSQAVFRDVWPELINDSRTFKMLCVDSSDTRIQGMLRVGQLTRTGGLLKQNLLEAVPFNQHRHKRQIYRGIGRVLVARLVAESIFEGGQGRVAVRARTGTEAFYSKLGFRGSPLMRLHVADAEALLLTALPHGLTDLEDTV